MRDEGRTDQSLIVSIPNISGKFVLYKLIQGGDYNTYILGLYNTYILTAKTTKT